MTDTRWCPHCQAERPLTEFYVNKAAASGIDGYCKEYRKAKQRERATEQRSERAARRAAQGLSPMPSRSPFRIDDVGRECRVCSSYKPWVEFHLDRNTTTGHQTSCKQCVRERQRDLTATAAGREASRRRTASFRERRRAPGWEPKQVTRHAQLDCDGAQHRCTSCGYIKLVSLFPRNRETPCGYDPRCSECRHTRRVERRATNHNDILSKEKLNWSLTKYGINADDYHWLLGEQEGGCALCGSPESQGEKFARGKTRLSVDHDHDHCGPSRACKACIRGLLCHDCNVGIAKFEYKPKTRVRFADYLDNRPFSDG